MKKKHTLLLLFIAVGTLMGYAQDVEYENGDFIFEDSDLTIIKGLSDAGEAAQELIIPARVTTVISGAFSNARNDDNPLTSLVVNGGNTVFMGSLFGRASTLTEINMGSGMSVDNMYALLMSLGSRGNLQTVDIEGYYGLSSNTWNNLSWDDNTIKDILTEDVSIRIPAELITDNQVFGEAKIYGHFPINKELITYCGSATFVDADNGSNMLFYVADSRDEIDEHHIHIQRVRYLVPGKGVLIHRTNSSTGYANLLRNGYSFADEIKLGTEQAKYDNSFYSNNMLVGVTEPTTITATDGNKTNMILSNGAFHCTSGGTLGANRAYLQIPTSWLSEFSRLDIVFPENEATGISDALSQYEEGLARRSEGESQFASSQVYDLQGRRVKKPGKGLYIVNGKNVVMK